MELSGTVELLVRCNQARTGDPAMTTDKENKILNHLIDINKDACAFYLSATEKVQNPRFQRSFSDLERLHEGVVIDLSRRLRENGAEVDADGTMVGKAAQFFGEIAAKISNDVDETLVSRLEEAEDRCLHSMRDALDEASIRPDTKAFLIEELSSLQKSHDYMKALKESVEAA